MMDRNELEKSIRECTAHVFETMLGLEVEPGEAYQEPNTSGTTEGVMALLGLAGSWVGTGILQCDTGLACLLYSRMLGVECEAGPNSITGDVLDAVAEIANMIVGNVKNALEERLGPMGLSIPTVIFGRNFTTRSVATDPWLVVPFECQGAALHVKFCLTPIGTPLPVRHGFTVPHHFGG